ncbi:hypothetical protein M885DRAFT_276291 [Pelagophyceae sp. CCMP2097]|nr:hypothetical protein M885DRAFT_276291 [Pelagophyceae sp. CCMP2097]
MAAVAFRGRAAAAPPREESEGGMGEHGRVSDSGRKLVLVATVIHSSFEEARLAHMRKKRIATPAWSAKTAPPEPEPPRGDDGNDGRMKAMQRRLFFRLLEEVSERIEQRLWFANWLEATASARAAATAREVEQAALEAAQAAKLAEKRRATLEDRTRGKRLVRAMRPLGEGMLRRAFAQWRAIEAPDASPTFTDVESNAESSHRRDAAAALVCSLVSQAEPARLRRCLAKWSAATKLGEQGEALANLVKSTWRRSALRRWRAAADALASEALLATEALLASEALLGAAPTVDGCTDDAESAPADDSESAPVYAGSAASASGSSVARTSSRRQGAARADDDDGALPARCQGPLGSAAAIMVPAAVMVSTATETEVTSTGKKALETTVASTGTEALETASTGTEALDVGPCDEYVTLARRTTCRNLAKVAEAVLRRAWRNWRALGNGDSFGSEIVLRRPSVL